MRPTPPPAIELIQHFEGFSPVVYADAAGWPTIGYGHLIRTGEVFETPISRAEGLALLRADLAQAQRSVERLVHVALSDGQYGALISFTFNLGGGALQRSSLRMKLNRGEYDDASAEFPRWVYAGGRKLRGLVLRRQAEQRMFLGENSL